MVNCIYVITWGLKAFAWRNHSRRAIEMFCSVLPIILWDRKVKICKMLYFKNYFCQTNALTKLQKACIRPKWATDIVLESTYVNFSQLYIFQNNICSPLWSSACLLNGTELEWYRIVPIGKSESQQEESKELARDKRNWGK